MDDEVVLYPNPATQNFSIKPSTLAYNNRECVVRDVLGRQVYKGQIRSAPVIDVRDWAKGFYNVQLRNAENVTINKKLTVQ